MLQVKLVPTPVGAQKSAAKGIESPEQKGSDGPASPYSTPVTSSTVPLSASKAAFKATQARRSTRLKGGIMKPRTLASMDVEADDEDDDGEDEAKILAANGKSNAGQVQGRGRDGMDEDADEDTAATASVRTPSPSVTVEEDPSLFDAAATLASLFESGSGSDSDWSASSPRSSPRSSPEPMAVYSAVSMHNHPHHCNSSSTRGDGPAGVDVVGMPSPKKHKAATATTTAAPALLPATGAIPASAASAIAASAAAAARATSSSPGRRGSSSSSAKRKATQAAGRKSRKSQSPSVSPKRKPVLGHRSAAAAAAAAAAPVNLPLSPAARSPTTLRPSIGLPQGCIRVTTFQTRSRDETRALQAEAEVLNKRYIPPGRPVFQCFAAPKVPPVAPANVEDANIYPFIRIGDTVELNFAMETPFDLMCKGIPIDPSGQTALGFSCSNPDNTAVLSLEFQIFYYSFRDGVVCLRCQNAPGKCGCNYASDLLEINRDWKAKRDPQRRLGLKEHSDGTCSIAIRVPRTRRKISKADKEAGIQQSDRPNTWNSKLRQLSSKDPKVIAIKMIEKRRSLTGSKETTVLAEHLAFSRLVAKNGGQPLTSGTSRKVRSPPSPSAAGRSGAKAKSSAKAKGRSSSSSSSSSNVGATSSPRLTATAPPPPASSTTAAASTPLPLPKSRSVSPSASLASNFNSVATPYNFAKLDAAASAAAAAAITAQAAAATATAHALRQVAAAADAAKAAAEAAPAGIHSSFALAGSSPVSSGSIANAFPSSPLALAISAAAAAAADPTNHSAAALAVAAASAVANNGSGGLVFGGRLLGAGAGAGVGAGAGGAPLAVVGGAGIGALFSVNSHDNTPEAGGPARAAGGGGESSDDGNEGATSRRNRAKRKLKWASAADSTDSI